MRSTVQRRVVQGCVAAVVIAGIALALRTQFSARENAPTHTKAELATIVKSQRRGLTAFAVSWRESDESPHLGGPSADGLFAVKGPHHWRYSLRVQPGPNSNAVPGLSDSSLKGDRIVSYWGVADRAVVESATDRSEYTAVEVPGSRYLRFLMYWPAASSTDTSPKDLVSLLAAANTALRDSLEYIDGTPCHVLDVRGPSGDVFGSIWIAAGQGGIPLRQRWNTEASLNFEVEEVAEIGGVFLPTRCALKFPSGEGVSLSVQRDGGGALLITRRPSAVDLPDDPMAIVPAGASVSDVLSGTTFVAHAGDASPPPR